MITERSDKLNNELINSWLEEDIGDGDHTTLSTIPLEIKGKANLLAKEDGIIAGISIAKKILRHFDPALSLEIYKNDGEETKNGDIIFQVSGSVRSILHTERLVLNIMQRMTGVATVTRKYVKIIEGHSTKILDTRKTTPGVRFLEKEAVRIGGGYNHRYGLYDMILIKDNHIDFAGGIENAVIKVRNYLNEKNKNLKIEVEARNLKDVKTILGLDGIDIIMLDNFSIEDTRKAVNLINGRLKTESSGRITIKNIRSYAGCGVDYISVGALTHHIKSIDLSLKAVR